MSAFLRATAILLSVAGAGSTPAASQQQLLWGVNGHPLTNYRGVSAEQQIDYLADLGLKSYRVDVLDERAVPRLRELVRLGKPRGIAILPVITPNVGFATATPEELYRRSFDRAVALVGPLKGDIRVWELGNELENYAIIKACEMRDNGEQYNCAWGPAGGVSPLDYYGPRWAKVSAVLRGLSDGVKSVDPTIRRAMGTAGWGHTGAFERMRADGLDWDISVWHMYGQDPEWAFKILAGYGKPIWVTEFNHPGGSSDGAEAQASGLVRQMQRLKELAPLYNVEAAHIYELMDEPYWAPSYEAVMGLVRLDKVGKDQWRAGEPKTAYHAARDFLAGRTGMAGAAADGAAIPGRNCNFPKVDVGDTSLPPRVAYAYCLILGREPDGGGLHAWAERLAKPTPVADMLVEMAGSIEFKARYGWDKLTDREFVALLYQLLLMRQPDGGGLAEYAAALESKRSDRASIVGSFLKSYEFAVRHPILSAPVAATPPATR
jgi:hypothetical protein